MPEDRTSKNDSGLVEIIKKLKPEDMTNPAIAAVLNAGQRAIILEFLENQRETPKEREKHEGRLQTVMMNAAEASGLQWDSRKPTDHPFRAELDGALRYGGKRVAVVELETRVRKQVNGALLDLLTHPERKKVLVIGRSKKVPYPAQLKTDIVEHVLPVVQSLLKEPAEIGVFTESELKMNPTILAAFIGLGDSR